MQLDDEKCKTGRMATIKLALMGQRPQEVAVDRSLPGRKTRGKAPGLTVRVAPDEYPGPAGGGQGRASSSPSFSDPGPFEEAGLGKAAFGGHPKISACRLQKRGG